VIGIAIGTALLPLLARQIRLGDDAAAGETQNRALEAAMVLTLPAAVALIVLAAPIISTLFERGAFDATAARETGRALVAYALGLPAYVLIKVLTPCFYARQDTRTPVKIAVLCVATNTVLALLLMQILAHVGIALASALAAYLNCLLLARALRARGLLALDPRVKRRTVGAMAASAAMGAALLLAEPTLRAFLAAQGPSRWFALGGLVALGLAVYAAAATATGALHPREFLRTLRRPAS
jgi:putative peptidoglycan lipid II flippase